jgi:hypothetical protein
LHTPHDEFEKRDAEHTKQKPGIKKPAAEKAADYSEPPAKTLGYTSPSL